MTISWRADMGELIGETVVSFKIESDRESLTFECASGRVLVYRAEGDCCSQSWFESVIGEQQLLNSRVAKVEEIEMDDSISGWIECYEEVVKYYGIRITTERGAAVVDYRNSSNGYYGGYCSLESDFNKNDGAF